MSMNTEVKDGRKRLGVATLLPAVVAARLVSAAARARALPADSVERKRIVEKAISEVRAKCPQAFRLSGENSRS